ncbi:uncharacterized protein ColSpa_00382 [Colletotrichum spaethianum]|uniref:Uncharacterized protein n=1 Tax=Colletotrichum spaethianum TaxID=700344 RepID=A0AA37L1X4_9PEZI|nr:uncharacterized protein ColSpa_00382 [Colletotrichum spaethianum]GKT40201.1 hypothetical protein ColSpa_00382 [Colletotrichum spaethianum]
MNMECGYIQVTERTQSDKPAATGWTWSDPGNSFITLTGAKGSPTVCRPSGKAPTYQSTYLNLG